MDCLKIFDLVRAMMEDEIDYLAADFQPSTVVHNMMCICSTFEVHFANCGTMSEETMQAMMLILLRFTAPFIPLAQETCICLQNKEY